MNKLHTFHIPVMGTGFSIDTPIKVAKYGISSVISIVDDCLIEDMRKFYCGIMGEAYEPITKYDNDFRARRITAYLNLVDRIVKTQFEMVRCSPFEPGSEITKYFELLPDDSVLKAAYGHMLETKKPDLRLRLQNNLRAEMRAGDICVNIMTKLDRTNYDSQNVELPPEFSDALAALRGYAQSTLDSAIVYSAGINRRLYSYMEKFKDFYADTTGHIKKRIILKVSDYRSALIQGRFLAKKGLWVSEYRIESGLNCGGHAFVSDGFLLGPILEEFKNKKNELVTSLHQIYNEVLTALKYKTLPNPHDVKITAQGGIGTYHEDKFLREKYEIDGTGWATPFLLVPEVTNVDQETLEKLAKATEDDIGLSEISPLGVPFHTLKSSPSELEKQRKIATGKPGSACPKSYLVSNTEFTSHPICTASRQYQKLKIDQLNEQKLDPARYQQQYQMITRKACICNDLAESPLINHHLGKEHAKRFTAICPGPNIAYFSKIVSLSEMVGHIYGHINLLNNQYRPHMFIKELQLNFEYFMKEVKNIAPQANEKQIAYLNEFRKNLAEGIEYYRELFPKMAEESADFRKKMIEELEGFKQKLESFAASYKNIFSNHALASF